MIPDLHEWLIEQESVGSLETEEGFLKNTQNLFMLGQIKQAYKQIETSQFKKENIYLKALFKRYENADVADWSTGFKEGFLCGQRYPDISKVLTNCGPRDLKGKKVIIIGDQGLGDQIRWSHHFLFLCEEAADVEAYIHPKLLPLMKINFPQVTFRSLDEFDMELLPTKCCVIALGDVDGKKWGVLPDSFLKPDSKLESYWGNQIDNLNLPGRKIGFCYRSTMQSGERNIHYTKIEKLLPLFKTRFASFISLQCDDDISSIAMDNTIKLHQIEGLDLFNDIASVAAVLAKLDLVISTSSVIADLASAVGTPVWRFQTGPNFDSDGVNPWYGRKTKMFYRSMTQTWDDIVQQMVMRLKETN